MSVENGAAASSGIGSGIVTRAGGGPSSARRPVAPLATPRLTPVIFVEVNATYSPPTRARSGVVRRDRPRLGLDYLLR